ncbi:MAG: LysR family transcriptional regulator [Lentisphaeria bacterium]|nr:LysR family transcriptional regulator [Lentisphaeria bacterium]
MITIKQLQNFLILSNELHFAKAAEKLGMSQAALSKEIQKLEQKIGCSLFDRSNKWDIRLTEAGKTYLQQISGIPDILEYAKNQAIKSQRGLQGNIAIGITTIACNYLNLGKLFRTVKTEYPDITMRITEQYMPLQTIELLQKGELDIAITPIRNLFKLPDNMKSKIISKFRLFYVLPANHPLAEEKNLTINDLINYNFILPSQESSPDLSSHFELFCLEKTGKKPIVTHEIDGLESTYQLVSANLGISVMPQVNINATNYNIVFVPCDLDIECSVVAIWDANNHSRTLQNVIKLF